MAPHLSIGCILGNPEMRPRRVVRFNVGGQDTPQMRLAHYDHMVEALSSDTFHISILPW
jgi:hypothetical protein